MNDVCHQLKKNETGMTLIEMLISLFIFLTIASIMPTVFSIWKQNDESAIVYEELNLFFAQFQLDVRSYTNVWTNDSRTTVYFTDDENSSIIQYEMYDDKIRRRVDGKGHEVFLQNVGHFHVEKSSYGLFVRITSVDDAVYERYVILPTLLVNEHEKY